MPDDAARAVSLHFPVISHGAELLVQGYLMRRNILTYKAPPNNKGYDLICIHPYNATEHRPICIQVKSRYATDSDMTFPVKEQTFKAFDFLVAVLLNVGKFYRKRATQERSDPEFYTLPVEFVRQHHDKSTSWEKLRLRGLDIKQYKNADGFELIAKALGIEYPAKP